MLSRRDWLTGAGLVAGIVAVYLVSLLLAPTGAEFGGTDSAASGLIDATAWAEPLFAPGSSELESGLFALQAALGALVLGFALGRLTARRR